MKLFILLSLAMFVSLESCIAQKSLIEITEANCGNTGHRGIQMRDENGNPMPMPKGNDYFNVAIKANKRTTVEIVSLVAKGMDGSTSVLNPTFTEGGKKRTIGAGETAFLRADKTAECKQVAELATGSGLLTLKVGKKKIHLLGSGICVYFAAIG